MDFQNQIVSKTGDENEIEEKEKDKKNEKREKKKLGIWCWHVILLLWK